MRSNFFFGATLLLGVLGGCQSLELVRLFAHGLTTNFDACGEFRRLELNTSLLMSLLNAKMTGDSTAVYYSGAYLAAREEDAEANFINMLPITDLGADSKLKINGLNPWLVPVPKHHIIQALSTTSNSTGRARRRRRRRQIASGERLTDVVVLPEELGIKKVIKHESGAVSVLEYCRAQGESDGSYLLPLCSMCAMTTHLPDTFFPPWINEIHCAGLDAAKGNGCLRVNYMDHGSCQQNTIWFSVLEAVPTKCELVTLIDGKGKLEEFINEHLNNETDSKLHFVPPSWRDSTYWVDGWDIAPQPVNTGCECMLHKDSFLNNPADGKK